MTTILVVAVSAILTFLLVNTLISRRRRRVHEIHGHDRRFEAIIKNVTDVSLKVDRLNKTLGGRM